MGRMENEKPGSRSARTTASSGASTAQIGPVDPALSPMRPVAAMGPPMSQVSRGYGAPYNTYTPYKSQNVLPTIEDRMHTESPFPYQSHMFDTPPKHGHYHQPMHLSSYGQHSQFNHMHPLIHEDETKYQPSAMDATPETFRKAQVPRDVDEVFQKITTLEKHIISLETDLAVAKNSMATQEERINTLEIRMQKYDTTAEGINHAERNLKSQASLLKRVVQGVQRIADVAGEVAHIMRSDGLGDRLGPRDNGNEGEDDDSGIGPDEKMA